MLKRHVTRRACHHASHLFCFLMNLDFASSVRSILSSWYSIGSSTWHNATAVNTRNFVRTCAKQQPATDFCNASAECHSATERSVLCNVFAYTYAGRHGETSAIMHRWRKEKVQHTFGSFSNTLHVIRKLVQLLHLRFLLVLRRTGVTWKKTFENSSLVVSSNGVVHQNWTRVVPEPPFSFSSKNLRKCGLSLSDCCFVAPVYWPSNMPSWSFGTTPPTFGS